MNIITHALVGWCAGQRLLADRRDMLLVTAGSVAPDIDGLGVLAGLVSPDLGLDWFSRYHHALTHNLVSGVVATIALGAVARDRLRTAAWVFVLFHLHLLCDVVGSRGPDGEQWPVPWLYPFSDRATLVWSGQWEVNAWPNLLFTVWLLALFLKQARDQGFSPIWYLSARADAAFVATLRHRFPLPS